MDLNTIDRNNLDQVSYENILVSIYYQISNYTSQLSEFKRNIFVKYLEEYYLDQSDTELGDFIDEMAKIYIFDNNDDNLHLYIRECIDDSELNYDMLYHVGLHILETVEYIFNYVDHQLDSLLCQQIESDKDHFYTHF